MSASPARPSLRTESFRKLRATAALLGMADHDADLRGVFRPGRRPWLLAGIGESLKFHQLMPLVCNVRDRFGAVRRCGRDIDRSVQGLPRPADRGRPHLRARQRRSRNVRQLNGLFPVPTQETTLKLTTIGLTAALMTLSSGLAMAQGVGSTGASAGAPAGPATVGSSATPAPGSSTTTGTGVGAGSPNYNAGGAAAGANSAVNPSGNSLINPSPSGSTLTPTPGSGTTGR
jgi:hypothetical protein